MLEWNPDELQQHIEANHLIFLKLWKTGCGACKLSKPALERISEKDSHGFTFAQINVAEYPEMLEVSGTEVLPAFFIFKDQKMLAKTVGFKGIKKLETFIEDTLNNQ